MSWTWRLTDADGASRATSTNPVAGASLTHATQSDAESWLGESWRALAESGVTAVSLFHDAKLVYGPMSLVDQAGIE